MTGSCLTHLFRLPEAGALLLTVKLAVNQRFVEVQHNRDFTVDVSVLGGNQRVGGIPDHGWHGTIQIAYFCQRHFALITERDGLLFSLEATPEACLLAPEPIFLWISGILDSTDTR